MVRLTCFDDVVHGGEALHHCHRHGSHDEDQSEQHVTSHSPPHDPRPFLLPVEVCTHDKDRPENQKGPNYSWIFLASTTLPFLKFPILSYPFFSISLHFILPCFFKISISIPTFFLFFLKSKTPACNRIKPCYANRDTCPAMGR